MKKHRIETLDGAWVRTNRQRLGWPQHRLASNINFPNGINPGRIAEIENGQRPIRPEWREEMQRIFTQAL